MAFYSSTEPGKQLGSQEAETKIGANIIPIVDEATGTTESKLYWGFISKDLLESLLNEPDCAGIRFYNTFRKDIQSKMLAVGVTEDGDEISIMQDGKSGYIVNRLKFTDDSETDLEEVALAHISREVAEDRAIASYTLSPNTAFASFFSAEAIRRMLSVQDCNGLCLYTVGTVDDAKPPFSHLAVAVQHLATDTKINRLGSQGLYLLCENPCPSHCAQEPAATEPRAEHLAARRYLISWE